MRLLSILPALALAACASTPPPSSASEPAMLLPSASLFNPVELPAATFDNPLAAAQYFARYNPSDEGATRMDLMSLSSGGPDTLVMIFFVDGYADDSVAGEQWRIQLSRATGGWRVTDAGRRVKCYRGANAGNWQQGLCP